MELKYHPATDVNTDSRVNQINPRWQPLPAACCACSAAVAGSEPRRGERVCVAVCERGCRPAGPLCPAPSSAAPLRSGRRPAASAASRSPPSGRPGSDHTHLQEAT